MYEPAVNFDAIAAEVIFLCWVVAGYRVGRLAFRRTMAALRRSARQNIALLGLGALAIVLKLAAIGPLWSFGWEFAQDVVIVSVPAFLLPAAAVAALSVPRLRRIARTAAATDESVPVDAAARTAAADPLLVVPIQATAVGALIGAITPFVSRPAPSYVDDLVIHAGVLTTATLLLWARQRRRQHLLGGPESRPVPGLGVRVLRALGVVVAGTALLGAAVAYQLWSSRLPDRMNMLSHSNVDLGGGPAAAYAMTHSGEQHATEAHPPTSVRDLTGPRTGSPNRSFTLTAVETKVRLSSGHVVEARAYNGQVPGPSLQVRQGELVQVTLRNELSQGGVTIHWHGLDVPNAEDGVPGLTQDAVQPGQSHVYRFRAEQVGTFWYHSHERPVAAVRRGLFGALVVLPKTGAAPDTDITVMAHNWPTPQGLVAAFGTSDTLRRQAVAPGSRVRLRIVNTDQSTQSDIEPRLLTLVGTPFRVVAIDGTDLNAPTDLDSVRLPLAEGGRYDLEFTMPPHPVQLADLGNSTAGLLLSPDGTGEVPPIPADAADFDPASYGSAAATPFRLNSAFDRRFRLFIDDRVGFFDGRAHLLPTINGETFPDTPMLLVREGELVKTTIVNRSHQNHPMHLHGHHALVLSRNGRPTSGSPWWTDTLDVRPGEMYEIAFRADNPGAWMDHCHDLGHAANGMTAHLVYDGVTTPYEAGRTANRPD